jgi:methionyl-tRNA formyltransferase
MTDAVLLSKKDKFSAMAQAVAKLAFPEIECISGTVGDPFPENVLRRKPQIILSFLSPWIVPASLLEASRLALNWHPASRDYPGIGCYNFALYEGAAEYGAVCHHMAPKVDVGAIVEERLFKVAADETVETLKLRTMITMTAMFHDMVFDLAAGTVPEACVVAWSRKPFTRRQLNALARLDAGMSAAEIQRRVRATTYPGYPGPQMEVDGKTIHFPVPDRPPLA